MASPINVWIGLLCLLEVLMPPCTFNPSDGPVAFVNIWLLLLAAVNLAVGFYSNPAEPL